MKFKNFYKIFNIIIFIIIFLSLSTFLFAEEPKVLTIPISSLKGPITIEANHLTYNRDKGLYTASGKVMIKFNEYKITANFIQYNIKNFELIARGNVLIIHKGDKLYGDSVHLNTKNKTGEIINGKIFLSRGSFHITGGKIKKVGEKRYIIYDGTLTSCDGKRPDWRFTGKRLNVEIEGFAVVSGVTFQIKNYPLIYVPWGIFPVITERQSGFLVPKLGYSSKYGPKISIPFFWAITDQFDSTFYLDYLGKRGIRGRSDFRWAWLRNSYGRLSLFYIDDHDYNDNRWAIFGKFAHYLNNNLYIKGDIDLVSDNEYPKDFGEDIKYRSQRYLRSQIFLGKRWSNAHLLARMVYFDDLIKTNNDETVQILPEIIGYISPIKLYQGIPLYFGGDLDFIHYWQEEGKKVDRFYFAPTLFLPYRFMDRFEFLSYISLLETFYIDENDGSGSTKSREVLDTGMKISTTLMKVYPVSFLSIKAVKHTIEPEIGYRYTSRSSYKELPLLDESDIIPHRNWITYGIKSRLIGKFATISGSRFLELLRLRIYQNYSLGDPIDSINLIPDSGKRLSNVRGELTVHLSPYLSYRFDTSLNCFEKMIQSSNHILTITDKRGDYFLTEVRYTDDLVEEINAGAFLKFTNNIDIFGSTKYSYLDDIFIESTIGVNFKFNCWGIRVILADRRRPSETEILFIITLKGIGDIKGEF